MRVELEDFPLFVGTFNSIVVAKYRTLTSRPRAGARSLSVSIASGYKLKVCKTVVLCEKRELDLVAGNVKECRVWLEDLPEYGVQQLGETCAGDVYEGEGDGEKGDGDIGWARDCHEDMAKERRWSVLIFMYTADEIGQGKS